MILYTISKYINKKRMNIKVNSTDSFLNFSQQFAYFTDSDLVKHNSVSKRGFKINIDFKSRCCG